MTGRDLIVYILQKNLEDEPILKNGSIVGFMNENEAAVKFEVGLSTIKVWHELGMLTGTKIGDSIFFLRHTTKPEGDR